MTPDLRPLPHPIGISADHVRPTPTTLRVKQHARSWSGGDFTITAADDDNEPGTSTASEPHQPLLLVEGRFASWSQQRTFTAATTGRPLFELSRPGGSEVWVVTAPSTTTTAEGGGGGGPVAQMQTVRESWKDSWKSRVRVRVLRNLAAKGVAGEWETRVGGEEEQPVLEVRGQDVMGKSAGVWWRGEVVMWVRRTDTMSVYVPWKGTEWEVRVAAGLDLGLVRFTDGVKAMLGLMKCLLGGGDYGGVGYYGEE